MAWKRNQKEQYENQIIDEQIEAGHIYVDLQSALTHAKDEAQARDIKAAMETLYKASGYLREVLDSYGPHFRHLALNDLARFRASNKHDRYRTDREFGKPRSSWPKRGIWVVSDQPDCVEAF